MNRKTFLFYTISSIGFTMGLATFGVIIQNGEIMRYSIISLIVSVTIFIVCGYNLNLSNDSLITEKTNGDSQK